MQLFTTLNGTDRGRSGLGTWARAVVPRLAERLAREGGALTVMGTYADLRAYEDALGPSRTVELPSALDRATPSVVWHLSRAGSFVRAHGGDALLFPAANRRAAACSGVPTVCVVHDLAEMHGARSYHPLREGYVKSVLGRALRRATRLVAISEATRRDLADLTGRDSADIRLVPNGVDTERFQPAGPEAVDAARSTFGLVRPYVLYPGRLEHPGKNHLRLLEAYARSASRASHDLIFCGPDWGGRALVEQTIAGLGLADRARWLGCVEARWLAPLVTGADAVVMPGLFEGFGLPALEALACGVPVAASSTGALPEVVSHLGVLFDPLDPRAMAAALDRVLTDETHRARVVAEGPAHAAARDWSRTTEGVHDACRSTLHA